MTIDNVPTPWGTSLRTISIIIGFIVLAFILQNTEATSTAVGMHKESDSWSTTMYGSMTPLHVSQHGTLVYLQPNHPHPPADQPTVAWDTAAQRLTIVCTHSGFVPRITNPSSNPDELRGVCVRQSASP